MHSFVLRKFIHTTCSQQSLLWSPTMEGGTKKYATISTMHLKSFLLQFNMCTYHSPQASLFHFLCTTRGG